MKWLRLALVGCLATGCSSGGRPNNPGTPDGGPDDPDAATLPDGDVEDPDAALEPDASVDPGPIFSVFADDYASGVAFAPFGGSATLPTVDTTEHHTGTASLKLVVPPTGYSGGAMALAAPTDLSGFDALTFWAKATKSAALNVVGFGNDSVSGTHFTERNQVAVTTEWQRFVVPIPLASKLVAERGVFHFAEGSEEGAYTVWFDDIRFEKLPVGTLSSPQPAIATEAVSKLVGDSFAVNGASVTWMVGGVGQTQATARPYFTFATSDPLVATVDATGQVTALAVGTATITAKLGDVDAVGAITLTVAPVTAPDTTAPLPALPATDVISLFSGAYTNVAVDTWRTSWSNATLTETQILTDDVKKYSNLVFVGIEHFATAPVDATTMTHFHVDVWTPDATAFAVKLVDFGANGAFGGGDDVEHQIDFNATSTPALTNGEWVSLDIPLASFTGLTTRAHLSQLIFVSSNSTVYVDNVYFHK